MRARAAVGGGQLGGVPAIERRPAGQFRRRALEELPHGLARRRHIDDTGQDERRYLAPIRDFVSRGITPAQELLQKYYGVWKGSVDPVFDEYAY